MIAFFTVSIANAQYTVMLVDDDANGSDNSETLITAMDNWGGTYSFINIEEATVPTYAEMSSYDMVIWNCGNDGLNVNLWDVADTTGIGYTAVKYNSALIEYLNNGGVLWVDAMDAMYDICPGTPSAFTAGDFIYDNLGIAEYSSQSNVDDDGLGVSEAVISTTNTVTTVTPLSWEWSSLFFGDGFTLTSEATSLYEMGGDVSYPLLGQSMMVANNNSIYSAMRVQRFGTQNMVNNLVSEMITAAEAGSFPAAVSVNKISKLSLNIYPNPVTETATINLSEINAASELMIFDNMGRNVYSQALNANQENVTINVSDLASGLYHINITSNNSIYTTKFSVVK